jgi:hypothetical protein
MGRVSRGATQSVGAQVAAVLAGSWREPVETAAPPLADLEAIAPRFLATGAGSLAWRRVRGSALAESAVGRELRDAHRLHAIQTAVRERIASRAAALLAGAGIEAVLVKGWAIARLYPEKGLRPFGDIDLCISPSDFSAAQSVLPPEEFAGHIDLHRGFEKFGGGAWDEMLARSCVATVGGSPVRLLGEEDHFRLLCFHLLRHGGWRPLWLCDVALALESRPAHFDWDKVLRGSHRHSDAIVCTVGLAHRLLGARIHDTPPSQRVSRMPRWLAPTVLTEWGTPQRLRLPMAAFLTQPALVLRESFRHFANPLEATVTVGGPWNDWPRLPFQLANAALRAAQFAVGLPGHSKTSQARTGPRR